MLLPTWMAVACLPLFVCFSARYLKEMTQLGSQNMTCKCSTMSPGNPFILGSKGQSKVMSHKNIAGVALYTLVSAGFF